MPAHRVPFLMRKEHRQHMCYSSCLPCSCSFKSKKALALKYNHISVQERGTKTTVQVLKVAILRHGPLQATVT